MPHTAQTVRPRTSRRALWLAPLALAAAADARQAIPVGDATRYFAEARRLSDADAGRLWGRPLYGPLLFADPATRAVVANEADAQGLLRADAGAFIGTLPQEQNVANTALDWAGRRWTMVMWPPPDAPYPRARLLIHELYHRVQDDLGLPSAGFSRSFAYITGPAYGLLLDAARPQWRDGLTGERDLAELLSDAMGLAPPTDPGSAGASAAPRYDGERLIARENERERARLARAADYRRRFIEGPALILPLSGDVRYSFNPNTVEALDDAATIYETTRLVDEWGILEVTGGGALLRREAGRMAEARVPVPVGLTAPPSRAEGWTLALNEGWHAIPAARAGDWTVERAR